MVSKPRHRLTTQQVEAADKAVSWYQAWTEGVPGTSAVHYIAGPAGTGKSTITPAIVRRTGARSVRYGSYTGRAARIMQLKGCPGATTIHRLLYRPWERRLEDGRRVVRFAYQGVPPADLIVLDECSMVDEPIARDLLAGKAPILVFGDPGQLPAIGGAGYFTAREPDSLLTEVHRQAKGHPIIAAGMAVRRDGDADLSRFDDRDLLRIRDSLDLEELADCDVVIAGKHRTRRRLNEALRRMAGHGDPVPVEPGARIVVLRNQHDLGLYNGIIYSTEAESELPDRNAVGCELEAILDAAEAALCGPQGAVPKAAARAREAAWQARLLLDNLDVTLKRFVESEVREPEDDISIPIRLWVGGFEADAAGTDTPPGGAALRDLDDAACKLLGLTRATWGYSITCHKAQGAQWNKVAVADDGWGRTREDRSRWRYTALTRAAERAVWIRGDN